MTCDHCGNEIGDRGEMCFGVSGGYYCYKCYMKALEQIERAKNENKACKNS